METSQELHTPRKLTDADTWCSLCCDAEVPHRATLDCPKYGALSRRCYQNIQELCDECKKLMTVNPDKNSAPFITKSCQGPVGHVSMLRQDIPWQDKRKYLGVFNDKKLTSIPHIDYIVLETNGF